MYNRVHECTTFCGARGIGLSLKEFPLKMGEIESSVWKQLGIAKVCLSIEIEIISDLHLQETSVIRQRLNCTWS